jgi:uncharacterized membrane protein
MVVKAWLQYPSTHYLSMSQGVWLVAVVNSVLLMARLFRMLELILAESGMRQLSSMLPVITSNTAFVSVG